MHVTANLAGTGQRRPRPLHPMHVTANFARAGQRAPRLFAPDARNCELAGGRSAGPSFFAPDARNCDLEADSAPKRAPHAILAPMTAGAAGDSPELGSYVHLAQTKPNGAQRWQRRRWLPLAHGGRHGRGWSRRRTARERVRAGGARGRRAGMGAPHREARGAGSRRPHRLGRAPRRRRPGSAAPGRRC